MQIIRFGYVYEEDCDMSDKTLIQYDSPIERPPFATNHEYCRQACVNLNAQSSFTHTPYATKSPLPISLDIMSDCSSVVGPSVVAFESKCLEALSVSCQNGYNMLEAIIFRRLPVIKGFGEIVL